MKSHELPRFVAPPPAPAPRCDAPGCMMAPDVTVPLGEGAIHLCWLCAHLHVDHGVALSDCANCELCEHTPAEIYPSRGAHLTHRHDHVLGTYISTPITATEAECASRELREVGEQPSRRPLGVFGRPRSNRSAAEVAGRKDARRRDTDVTMPRWRSRNGRAAGLPGASYPKGRRAKS